MNLTYMQISLITQFAFPLGVGLVAYLYRRVVPDTKRTKVGAIVTLQEIA